MNVNFGLLPRLDERIRDKKEKKLRLARRALDAIMAFQPQAEADLLD